MSDVWVEMFRNYIIDYDSINHLERDGIFDDEEANEFKIKLLREIIETMKSEVEE